MTGKRGGAGVYIFLAIVFVLGMMFIGGFFNSVFKQSPVKFLDDGANATDPIKVKPLELSRGLDRPVTISFYNGEGVSLTGVRPSITCDQIGTPNQGTNAQDVDAGKAANYVVMMSVAIPTPPGFYNCRVKVSSTERSFQFEVK